MVDVIDLGRRAELAAYAQVLVLLREKDIYWNRVAYDKRQAGKSDIDPAGRAGECAMLGVAVKKMMERKR